MMINTAIISNPINWVKVWLMATTFFVAVYLVSNLIKDERMNNAAASS